MAQRKTNVQIVKDIMEKSKYGVLAQAFVIEAIVKLIDQVEAMPLPDMQERFRYSVISPEAWKEIAAEIKEKLADYYPKRG